MNRKNELVQIINSKWNVSRSPTQNKETLAQMMRFWELGFTDSGVASEIGVSSSLINVWMKNYPELKELKDLCYVKINNKARENIYNSIKKGSIKTSQWFLERTDPEFSTKNEQYNTQINIVTVQDREKELARFMERFGTDERAGELIVDEGSGVSEMDQGTDTVALQEGERVEAGAAETWETGGDEVYSGVPGE